MATVEKIEATIRNHDLQAVWMEPFLRVLGDPSKWHYTGKCIDSGPHSGAHCICGESIRYLFFITDDTQEQIVGSVCIDHFMDINPSLYADLLAADKMLRQQLAEAERKAKYAAQEARVQSLRQEFDRRMKSLETWCNYYRNKNHGSWRPLPDWLYYGLRQIGNCPAYQRPTSYLAWYAKKIEWIDKNLLPNIPGCTW
jgi:hypothetical protein